MAGIKRMWSQSVGWWYPSVIPVLERPRQEDQRLLSLAWDIGQPQIHSKTKQMNHQVNKHKKLVSLENQGGDYNLGI